MAQCMRQDMEYREVPGQMHPEGLRVVDLQKLQNAAARSTGGFKQTFSLLPPIFGMVRWLTSIFFSQGWFNRQPVVSDVVSNQSLWLSTFEPGIWAW